jgi:hypothetical protein
MRGDLVRVATVPIGIMVALMSMLIGDPLFNRQIGEFVRMRFFSDFVSVWLMQRIRIGRI